MKIKHIIHNLNFIFKYINLIKLLLKWNILPYHITDWYL